MCSTFLQSLTSVVPCGKMATHVADRNQECTVWVGGLEPPATEELLYELMLQAGPVVTVNMPRDAVTQAHQVRGLFVFRIARTRHRGSGNMLRRVYQACALPRGHPAARVKLRARLMVGRVQCPSRGRDRPGALVCRGMPLSSFGPRRMRITPSKS